MTVRVKKGSVGVRNGIAVRVVLISNDTVGTVLVIDKNGKPFEPSHSRFREDGQQVRSEYDLDIPPADYSQMFFMAGGIIGKPRREKVPTR